MIELSLQCLSPRGQEGGIESSTLLIMPAAPSHHHPRTPATSLHP